MIAPLLHVGYPKTGTTWLQQHLFPSEAAGFAILKRRWVKQKLVYPHALAFNPDECLASLGTDCAAIAARGLVPVISMERLSGDPHAGGYDAKEMADRLHRCFPEGKVLIVIREQRSMLLSAYRQYVQAGGPSKLGDYLVPAADPEQRRMHLFDFEHFNYDRFIRYYVSLFGADNVLVLPFEMFATQPLAFVQKIADFAGARPQPGALEGLPFGQRENEGKAPLAVALKRRLNVLFMKGSLNPWVLLPIPGANQYWRRSLSGRVEAVLPRWLAQVGQKKTRALVKELVGDRYKESNAQVVRMTNLDLKPYGYDLPLAS